MNTTTYNLNGNQLRVIWSDPLTPWFIAKDLCKAFGIEECAFLKLVLERDKSFVMLDGQGYNVVTDFGACAALYSFTEEGSDDLRRLVCLEVLLSNEPYEVPMETLKCDVCDAKIIDFESDLFHYSGTLRGRESRHIHLCSRCKTELNLPFFDFDAAMEKLKGV